MAHKLKSIGVGLAACFIVLIIFMQLFLGQIVKISVEAAAPHFTKTSVSLGSVRLSPLSGKGTIKNFVVGNPEAFKTEYAFSCDEITFNIKLSSLFSNEIVIQEIAIIAPQITYEQGLTSGSNISTLINNISSGSEKEENEEPQQKSEGSSKKVVIDHFILAEGKVHLSAVFLQGKALTTPLPTIEMNDIGKDSDGASITMAIQEVVAAIAESLQEAVVSANPLFKDGAETLGNSAKALQGAIKDAGGSLLEGGKGFFDSIFQGDDEDE
ncbi:MAG: hypothetical protein HN411_00680 [Waddliaceae bacterium]|nr:hypothetical protein [Waddliaceae bacterium]MBT3579499.1 hypothetical protein [Waddliaceae bacterium]MBT4444644.1 hypothetical protein [Waddliaceae bacterium]MBT6929209.1 hypothetical protein [Waddliaceae bacterium]MBT7264776.1 hypothetical protein [Waddliaceae bacterium]